MASQKNFNRPVGGTSSKVEQYCQKNALDAINQRHKLKVKQDIALSHDFGVQSDPLPERSLQRDMSEVRGQRCFKCGKVGHLAGQCPAPDVEAAKELREWRDPTDMEQLEVFQKTVRRTTRRLTSAAAKRPHVLARAQSAKVRRSGDTLVTWKTSSANQTAKTATSLNPYMQNRPERPASAMTSEPSRPSSRLDDAITLDLKMFKNYNAKKDRQARDAQSRPASAMPRVGGGNSLQTMISLSGCIKQVNLDPPSPGDMYDDCDHVFDR